jgi:insulysin
VVHGNWTEEKVRKSLEVLLAEIRSKPLLHEKRYQEVVEVLDLQEVVLISKKVEDNNNALHYGLQIGSMDYSGHAKASLVASIVETDFYTQMRTNQQLGYIVWSFNNRIEDRLFFRFIIQSSTYGPFELKARVETWMSRASKLFDNLTDEEFERHRKGLIVSLEKKGDSIAEVTGDLYYYATQEKGNFEFKRQLIEVVKNMKKEEVVAAAREIFLDAKTPRIIIFIRSRSNNEPVPEGVLTTVDQFKNRKAALR